MRRFRTSMAVALVAVACHVSPGAALQTAAIPPVAGRWDITVATPEGTYPSWLEVEPSGNKALVGRFVGRFGSSRPISEVHFDNGKMWFSIPLQWEQGSSNELAWEGQVQGDTITGTTTDATGAKYPFKAVRAPELSGATTPKWGKPVVLFDGKDLNAWGPRDARKNNWVVKDKVLSNTAAGTDLITKDRFKDFKLHVEFRYPKSSNSGIYLRGRYEVQITDDDNRDVRKTGLGSIYGFIEPSVAVTSHPGEWQTYDITLVGRLVTIVLNGKTIISEREIPGITGGAVDSEEGAPGPIYIQGDHGPIEYRSIVITPAQS